MTARLIAVLLIGAALLSGCGAIKVVDPAAEAAAPPATVFVSSCDIVDHALAEKLLGVGLEPGEMYMTNPDNAYGNTCTRQHGRTARVDSDVDGKPSEK